MFYENTGELEYDVRQIFAYDGQYAWPQSNAYQVFVICIRQIFLVPLSPSYPSSPVLTKQSDSYPYFVKKLPAIDQGWPTYDISIIILKNDFCDTNS